MIHKLIVPSTQQLFLTHVKILCTTILVVLFLLTHKLIDNSLPLQSASELVEVFLPLGLNQVQGLILGLVFQVGGLRVSGTRVKSTSWTRVTEHSSTPPCYFFY